MNKALLVSAFLLCSASVELCAQNYVYHEFADQKWTDDTGFENSPYGVFNKVSANGKYAVGYDDVVETNVSFLWRSEAPTKIEYVNTTPNRISLCDVSNDGVMVGSFENRAADKMDKKVVAYPGYKTLDGEWKQLPVPDNYSEKMALGQAYMEEARAITPDGQFVAGNIHLITGYNEQMGLEKSSLLPCLWKKSADGYELAAAYENLGDAGKSMIYSDGELKTVAGEVNIAPFLVWDISNDGSIIVGTNTSGVGGQNPAFIKDGKLIQLFDCGEEDETGEDEDVNFNGGTCNSIDSNNNIYGYFVLADGESTKYFIYTADGKLEYQDRLTMCATKDGTKFPNSYNGLPYLLDCSEDGSVLVGGGTIDIGFGIANTPAVLISSTLTAIDRVNEIRSNVSIDYRNSGSLFVNGEYQEATVYNAAGARIAVGKQGKSFNLSNSPSGTYIVKVTTANGVKSFKVAK